MSRTKCPHCGGKVTIYARVEKREAGPRPYNGRIDLDEARAMRAAGKSYAEIGKQFGVSPQAAVEVCKRYLLEPEGKK